MNMSHDEGIAWNSFRITGLCMLPFCGHDQIIEQINELRIDGHVTSL